MRHRFNKFRVRLGTMARDDDDIRTGLMVLADLLQCLTHGTGIIDETMRDPVRGLLLTIGLPLPASVGRKKHGLVPEHHDGTKLSACMPRKRNQTDLAITEQVMCCAQPRHRFVPKVGDPASPIWEIVGNQFRQVRFHQSANALSFAKMIKRDPGTCDLCLWKIMQSGHMVGMKV